MNLLLLNEESYQKLLDMLNEIHLKLDEVNTQRPFKEVYLDNEALCHELKVSPRTLQNRRDSGVLPYIKDEGKIYYKASDVEAYLNSNYINKQS